MLIGKLHMEKAHIDVMQAEVVHSVNARTQDGSNGMCGTGDEGMLMKNAHPVVATSRSPGLYVMLEEVLHSSNARPQVMSNGMRGQMAWVWKVYDAQP